MLLAEQGRGKNFVVYKPNIGKQSHPESLDNLQQRYRKVSSGSDGATQAETVTESVCVSFVPAVVIAPANLKFIINHLVSL